MLPGSWGRYDCVIKDVSEVGARIKLAAESAILPKEFELILLTEAISYPVLLRWRRDAECGVEFTGPAQKVTTRGR